jgi:hypothetical protein
VRLVYDLPGEDRPSVFGLHLHPLEGPRVSMADLLHMLEGAVYPDNSQAMEGATFKSLAYVAHLYALSHEERQKWYIVDQELPLSQTHVSYITRNIHTRNEILSDLEEMVKERG